MRHKRASQVALVIALAAGTVGGAACAGGRLSLGTAAGACFRALPPAQTAIANKGRLVGVRRVTADSLRAKLPNDKTLATLPDQDLCVFAFNGSYPPGSVAGARNTITGHYAVIAVSTKNPAVVGVFVLDKLPTRFQHLH